MSKLRVSRRDALRSIIALPVVGPAALKAASEPQFATLTETFKNIGDGWVLYSRHLNGWLLQSKCLKSVPFVSFDEVTT